MFGEDLQEMWDEIEAFNKQRNIKTTRDAFDGVVLSENIEDFFKFEDFADGSEIEIYVNDAEILSTTSSDAEYLSLCSPQSISMDKSHLLMDPGCSFTSDKPSLRNEKLKKTKRHMEVKPLKERNNNKQNYETKSQLFENIPPKENEIAKTFMLRSNSENKMSAMKAFDLQQFKSLFKVELTVKDSKAKMLLNDVTTTKAPNKVSKNINNAVSKKNKCKPDHKSRRKRNERKIREQHLSFSNLEMSHTKREPKLGSNVLWFKTNRCYHLWDFLRDILSKKIHPQRRCVEWVSEVDKEFRVLNTRELAALWGGVKRSKTMTYDKMSRAIRYYCSLDILKKVEGKRLQFKFGNGKMWTKANC